MTIELTILLIPMLEAADGAFEDLSKELKVESDLLISSNYGTSASGIWLGTVGCEYLEEKVAAYISLRVTAMFRPGQRSINMLYTSMSRFYA